MGDAADKTSESVIELKRAFKVKLKKKLKKGAGSMTSGWDAAELEMEELKAQLEGVDLLNCPEVSSGTNLSWVLTLQTVTAGTCLS